MLNLSELRRRGNLKIVNVACAARVQGMRRCSEKRLIIPSASALAVVAAPTAAKALDDLVRIDGDKFVSVAPAISTTAKISCSATKCTLWVNAEGDCPGNHCPYTPTERLRHFLQMEPVHSAAATRPAFCGQVANGRVDQSADWLGKSLPRIRLTNRSRDSPQCLKFPLEHAFQRNG